MLGRCCPAWDRSRQLLLGGLLVALSQQSAGPIAPSEERAEQTISQKASAPHDA